MNTALSQALIQALAQGVGKALQEALPHVDASSRNIAASHVADLVLRVVQDQNLVQSLKDEPVVVAPKMDLKKELK